MLNKISRYRSKTVCEKTKMMIMTTLKTNQKITFIFFSHFVSMTVIKVIVLLKVA